MNIIRKDALITPTGSDEDFPGTFEVILSAPTKDRDGETLMPDEWKQPLPSKITFDSDHGMSVATTVGSGVPSINSAGELVVSGTFSSLPRAQEVRTLVKEGHINTTSVAFMTERTPTKDGKQTVTRELLNGAFVAIPSNREALVLSSKSTKAGARNSASDMEHIQAIHDHAIALGAMPMDDGGKSARRATTKSVIGSLEATQDRARDALNDAYAAPQVWVWLRATLPSTLIFDVSTDSSETETYEQDYTDDGSVITLTGERRPVDVAEVVTPDPDEPTEPAANVTTAAANAAAAVTKAAEEDDSIEMQYRAVTALASAYLPE